MVEDGGIGTMVDEFACFDIKADDGSNMQVAGLGLLGLSINQFIYLSIY